MRISFLFLFSLLSSVVNCDLLDKRAKVGGGGGGGGGKICGTSFCDVQMLTLNAATVYHVPDISVLPKATWNNNVVNAGVLTTVYTTIPVGTSRIKYGGFCAQAQKTLYFLGSFPPPATIPAPSWIANIPVGDLLSGVLKAGFTYKLDVTVQDIKNMNNGASTCKTTCINTPGCKYASYGWESPAGWFCKLYSTGICTDSIITYWKPSLPALPVLTVGGPAPTTIPGNVGGCKITDTISTTTPYLSSGTFAISPLTAYTVALPYLTAPVSGIVTSIRCDVAAGGLTPGWPTFGTVWI